MNQPKAKQAAGTVAAILIVALLAAMGLLAIGRQLHWLPHGVIATRLTAVAYLICDAAISFSMITLLITRERRAPFWLEQRLPFRGRWLWHLLLVLTILSYASLAPTFLFFYLQAKK